MTKHCKAPLKYENEKYKYIGTCITNNRVYRVMKIKNSLLMKLFFTILNNNASVVLVDTLPREVVEWGIGWRKNSISTRFYGRYGTVISNKREGHCFDV